jgi:hypothetical protein
MINDGAITVLLEKRHFTREDILVEEAFSLEFFKLVNFI